MIDYFIILLFFFFGIIILLGKGDFLISGYNTASKEEKEKVNVKRLRIIVSSLLFIVAIGKLLATLCVWSEKAYDIFGIVILVLAVVSVMLSKTWARK